MSPTSLNFKVWSVRTFLRVTDMKMNSAINAVQLPEENHVKYTVQVRTLCSCVWRTAARALFFQDILLLLRKKGWISLFLFTSMAKNCTLCTIGLELFRRKAICTHTCIQTINSLLARSWDVGCWTSCQCSICTNILDARKVPVLL